MSPQNSLSPNLKTQEIGIIVLTFPFAKETYFGLKKN